MITLKTGSIITEAKTGAYEVLMHGCNCFGVMGAGVAFQIAQWFPNAKTVDQLTTRGDRSKLGTWSEATHSEAELSFRIFNLYTQFNFGNNVVQFDYAAFEKIMEKLNSYLPEGTNALIPRIGAGLAGGDWLRIEDIILKHTTNYNLTIVAYLPHVLYEIH